MRLSVQITIIVGLIGLLAISWWLLEDKGKASAGKPSIQRPATIVLTETVKFAEDRLLIRAIGTGEALKSVSIYPSVAGEVVGVAFIAGQRVKMGDVLVRLDAKHQRLAVKLADVAFKEAARNVERLETLAPTGAASVARLQTAQSEHASARLRLNQARASLSDRTIYAPFDGIVGLTDIERGDRVSDQTLIATLDDRSSILVHFNLPEEFAVRLGVGDPITMAAWTDRDTELHGVVHSLGSRIDRVTRTLRVKAIIPNPEDRIRPGSSFDVRLSFKGRRYATIPEVAVLWSRDGAYLWRVNDNRAEKIFVAIVRRDKGRILVDGPLQAGETIVVEGVQGLRPGQLIRTELSESAS
jgi:RND family efflux transporter MFP subunit